MSIYSFQKKEGSAYEHHARFHKDMIDGVIGQLSGDEVEALIKALTKLNTWFRSLEEN